MEKRHVMGLGVVGAVGVVYNSPTQVFPTAASYVGLGLMGAPALYDFDGKKDERSDDSIIKNINLNEAAITVGGGVIGVDVAMNRDKQRPLKDYSVAIGMSAAGILSSFTKVYENADDASPEAQAEGIDKSGDSGKAAFPA